MRSAHTAATSTSSTPGAPGADAGAGVGAVVVSREKASSNSFWASAASNATSRARSSWASRWAAWARVNVASRDTSPCASVVIVTTRRELSAMTPLSGVGPQKEVTWVGGGGGGGGGSRGTRGYCVARSPLVQWWWCAAWDVAKRNYHIPPFTLSYPIFLFFADVFPRNDEWSPVI